MDRCVYQRFGLISVYTWYRKPKFFDCRNQRRVHELRDGAMEPHPHQPQTAKYMAIPHYPYLLLKMPGPNGVLSLRSDLKRAFDCDVQAIQIAVKAQANDGRKEITTVAAEMNPEELEIPAKKPSILAPPKKADVKQIDLCTGDPSKTATIGAHLSAK